MYDSLRFRAKHFFLNEIFFGDVTMTESPKKFFKINLAVVDIPYKNRFALVTNLWFAKWWLFIFLPRENNTNFLVSVFLL